MLEKENPIPARYGYCIRCSSPISIPGLSASYCPQDGWILPSLVKEVLEVLPKPESVEQPQRSISKAVQVTEQSAPAVSSSVEALITLSTSLPEISPTLTRVSKTKSQTQPTKTPPPKQMDLFGGVA
ncbi:hypothetical protein ACQ4M3_29125 [Leptolyngbya sp. AN03gr2]|uniref:hypothetical protein n=1 Tax=unclassified Leptolyngbya TaxID=2650499 RepID=UPI003D30F298